MKQFSNSMQIVVTKLYATFQSDQTNRNMTFLSNTFTLIKTDFIFKLNQAFAMAIASNMNITITKMHKKVGFIVTNYNKHKIVPIDFIM
jgi:hypothetical protein